MCTFIRRLKWLTAALVAVVLLPIGAALADSRPDLVIAVNKLPRSLEGAEKTGNVDVRVTYSIYDTLIRRDFLNPPKAGELPKLAPGLATSWKRVDDTTLELKLRKGVTFHNGNPFTADDVAFTFSKLRLTGKKATIRRGKRYFGHVEKIKVIDDHTVQIITKHPDIMLEQRLATYASWIVDKETYEQYKEKGEKWAEKRNAKAAKAKDEKKKKKKKKKKVKLNWLHYALDFQIRA